MQIVEHPTELHVSIPYDRFRVRNTNTIKQLDGSKFDWTRKSWIVPIRYKETLQVYCQKFKGEWITALLPTPQIIGEIKPLPELEIEIDIVNKENGYTPRPYQLQGMARGLELKRFINGDEPGLGKSEVLTAKIQSPNGPIEMGNIKIGDDIFSQDGTIQKVTGVYPQGVVPTYRITFSDDSVVECNLEHIWAVRDENRRRRNGGFINKTLKDLLDMGIYLKSNKLRESSGRQPVPKWEIPICEPVQYADKDLFIDSYIMGVLLGDGSLTSTSISLSLPNEKHGIIK